MKIDREGKITSRYPKDAIVEGLRERLTDLEELDALVRHQAAKIEALARRVSALERKSQ